MKELITVKVTNICRTHRTVDSKGRSEALPSTSERSAVVGLVFASLKGFSGKSWFVALSNMRELPLSVIFDNEDSVVVATPTNWLSKNGVLIKFEVNCLF